MAVRIKTISNGIQGTGGARANDRHEVRANDRHEVRANDRHEVRANDRHEVRANDRHEARASGPSGESRQTNMILELEWEALGRKLKKHVGKPSNGDIERLQKQLKDKDEQLKQAERRIAELKKQLFVLQEKQRLHKQQASNVGGNARHHTPGTAPKGGARHGNARPQPHGYPNKGRDQGKK